MLATKLALCVCVSHDQRNYITLNDRAMPTRSQTRSHTYMHAQPDTYSKSKSSRIFVWPMSVGGQLRACMQIYMQGKETLIDFQEMHIREKSKITCVFQYCPFYFVLVILRL